MQLALAVAGSPVTYGRNGSESFVRLRFAIIRH